MEIYTARPGDTIPSLARRFGISERELAFVNDLGNPKRLTAGLALIIPSPQGAPTVTIESGACIPTDTPDSVFTELLPSLGFFCPYCRRLLPDGRLTPLDSGRLAALAKEHAAAPLLAVTNTDGQGAYSAATAHAVLSNPSAADAFLKEVSAAISGEGFRGLYLELMYLYPFDREAYNSLLRRLAEKLHSMGAYLITALAPKEAGSAESLICAAHDYACHGECADRSVLLGCDWGHALSAPQAVAPSDRIRRALDYSAAKLPTGKLLLGLPAQGYRWDLPWRQGDTAAPVFHAAAANLAVSTGAEVKLDRAFQSPYFIYTAPTGQRRAVWFEDARSILSKLRLMEEYSLAGIFFINGGRVSRPILRLLQGRYTVERLE